MIHLIYRYLFNVHIVRIINTNWKSMHYTHYNFEFCKDFYFVFSVSSVLPKLLFSVIYYCVLELNGTFRKMACVILLEQKIFIAIKKQWVQNPMLYSKTVVFHSPNIGDEADFEFQKMFYFHQEKIACYNGYVNQIFGMYF